MKQTEKYIYGSGPADQFFCELEYSKPQKRGKKGI